MSLVLAAALALVPLPPLQGKVWVVDDQPGPGVDYQEIHSAVEAAADGDTILVKPGTYPSFTILGKALVVAADGGPVSVQGGFSVRALAADQEVVVRGLQTTQPKEAGAQVKSCQGPVWIEDCVLAGAVGDNSYGGTFTWHSFAGLEVVGSDEVVLARCEITGGIGPDLVDEDFQFAPGDGGHGLLLDGGRVSVFDSTLTGGHGGTVWDTTDDHGGHAGSGVRVQAGSVLVSGSSLTGGNGGHGDHDPFFGGCGTGGSGGDGIHLPFGSTGEARWQDCTFAPGSAGIGGPGCGPGVPGEAVDVDGGSAAPLPGTARRFAATSPHREGEVSTWTFHGEPGDLVLAGVSFGQDHLFLETFAGTFVLAPSFFVSAMGTVPASSVLSVPVTVPPSADPLEEVRSFRVQTAHVSVAPEVWLGHASAITLLDSSF